jgi:hypothetical protein
LNIDRDIEVTDERGHHPAVSHHNHGVPEFLQAKMAQRVLKKYARCLSLDGDGLAKAQKDPLVVGELPPNR